MNNLPIEKAEGTPSAFFVLNSTEELLTEFVESFFRALDYLAADAIGQADMSRAIETTSRHKKQIQFGGLVAKAFIVCDGRLWEQIKCALRQIASKAGLNENLMQAIPAPTVFFHIYLGI